MTIRNKIWKVVVRITITIYISAQN